MDENWMKLSREIEFLMQRVSSLEKALDAAGIKLPPTRVELAQQAEALGDQWAEAAKRGE